MVDTEIIASPDAGYLKFKLKQPDNTEKQLAIDDNGCLYTNGTTPAKGVLQYFAYDFPGEAGTFNGVVCDAAGLSVLDDRWYFATFDDGGGAGIAEAVVMSWCVPQNYADGTDFSIRVNWTSGATSGETRWQCGFRPASIGDDMTSAANDVWATPQNVTVPATIWKRAETVFTLSGTGVVKGDLITLIVFRDADNGGDTSSGDSFVNTMCVRYERSD